MSAVERHTSPDGILHLVVEQGVDGDWTVGFEGFAWHTHGDLLTLEYGEDPARAVRAFVDEILHSKRMIVLSRVHGAIRDAWVLNDLEQDETNYAEPHETIERRFWSGGGIGPPFQIERDEG